MKRKRIRYILLTLCIGLLSVFAAGCSFGDLTTKFEQLTCKHDYTAMKAEVEVEATCTVEGKEVYECANCHKKKTVTLPMLEHKYTQTSTVIEANCLQTGKALYACEVCGHTKTEVVPKTGHKIITVEGQAATCTTAGYTTYKYCEVCKIYTAPKVTIPKLGHSTVVDKAVAPTCLEMGKKAGSHCGRCGEVLVAQEEVVALGHLLVTVAAEHEKPCTQSGWTSGVQCGRCGVWETERVEVPALGHTEGSDGMCTVCHVCVHSATETLEALAPTCTTTGLTEGSKCTKCKIIFDEQEVIPALGHTFGEDWVCTVCGAEHEHTVVEDKAVAPTCLESGLTMGSHCSVCEKVILAQEVIQASNDYHVIVVDAAVEATCTTEGWTAGSHCDVCDAVLEEQESIPATGHTPDDATGLCSTCSVKLFTGGLSYTLINDGTAYSVGYSSNATDTDVVIPATYKGLPVTTIKSSTSGFRNRGVTSVVMPDSITTIGDNAFADKNGTLTRVVLSKNIEQWGTGAFAWNEGLKTVVFPEGLKSIGSDSDTVGAFALCNNLSSVVLPSTLQSIGYRAFNGTALRTVSIPNSVTNIASYAFSGCNSLKNVTLPTGLTTISSYLFSGCDVLSSVVIPSGVTTIASHAFADTSIVQMIIPESVTSVEMMAFWGMFSLTSITIRGTVPFAIAGYAFHISDSKVPQIWVPASALSSFKSSWTEYTDYLVGN